MAIIITSGNDTPKVVGCKGTHTKSDNIDDFCENIRQDFDIYRNIDHQKAKKLKKKQRKKRTRHTNKQAIKQINKRTDEETTKTNKPSRLFLVIRCNGWSHCVWPNETNK